MKTYSMDLRERVLADCDGGIKTKKVAVKYRVSPAWVRRLKQRRRETGGFGPKTGPTRVPSWLPHVERIRRAVESAPDATLVELRERLRLKIGISTLCRALQALKLTFKKSAAGLRAGPARREAGT